MGVTVQAMSPEGCVGTVALLNDCCKELGVDMSQTKPKEKLDQELPGEHSFRIPLPLQQPQLSKLVHAPEAKFDGVSPGCVLEVGILGSIGGLCGGNALCVQLGDLVVARGGRIPNDVVSTDDQQFQHNCPNSR